MRAMVLSVPHEPLELQTLPVPKLGIDEVLIRVTACGVCRTDLHVVDGELKEPKLPIIPGHEIVGLVESFGAEVKGFETGQRVVVPWLGGTCGECYYCRQNQ